jgi:hypothetical protein
MLKKLSAFLSLGIAVGTKAQATTYSLITAIPIPLQRLPYAFHFSDDVFS